MTTLALGPVRGRVRFTRCDAVRDGIVSILRGWSVEDVSALPGPAPTVRLKRTEAGYRRVSPWRNSPALAREKTRRHVVGAICGFHFELVDWYLREHPGELCIHGAAALFEPGLFVFPAVQRVGKSVLTVDLARRGVPIFCDDVLPVEIGSRLGVALGILPRLRPPLPPDVSPEFRAYVEAHRGPGYRDRLYVAPPEGVMVPYGARTPIGGVVLLERAEGLAPSIEPVDPAEALEAIILQNFAVDAPAERVLDTLHDVVSRASCVRLRYARAEEAGALLVKTFGMPGRTKARGAGVRRAGRTR